MHRPFVLVKSSHAQTLAMMQHIMYEFLVSHWTTFTAHKPHNKWLLLYGMDNKIVVLQLPTSAERYSPQKLQLREVFSTVATTERGFLHSSYNWEVFSTEATTESGFLHSSYNWESPKGFSAFKDEN